MMNSATMGIRETLKEKPSVGIAIAAIFVLLTAVITVARFWPTKTADLSQSYYSDDDGQTWFADSAFRVPPFDHNGKTAFGAQIFSYADGKKQFCAYLVQYTPDAKKKMEAALADAARKGEAPGSITLYQDRTFTKNGLRVKKPGAGNSWMSYGDPKANEVFTIKSPDGSPVDQSFVY
jgi:hypothetical protein